MSTYTAQTLIDRAASIADMHDNYISPTEWLAWMNQEQYALRLYLARCGWPLEMTTTLCTILSSTSWTLTTLGTVNTVSAATTPGVFTFTPDTGGSTFPEIMAVVAIYESTSGGLALLQADNAVDFMHQLDGSTLTQGHARHYRVNTTSAGGLNLAFFPSPVVGETYLVTFIQVPTTLTINSSVSLPMGWEERIVLGMARRAMIKEESDPGKVERLILEIEQQIEELAWDRVLSETPTVRNTDQSKRGWYDRIIFPPWQQWSWR